MKNIFLVIVLILYSKICHSSEQKVSEKDVQVMIKKIKEDRASNSSRERKQEQELIKKFKTNKEIYSAYIQKKELTHQKKVKEKLEIENSPLTRIKGIYSPGSFFKACNSEIDIIFNYGEIDEIDKLVAAYFVLTKEPYTSDNFEPNSLMYIEAEGKLKTETTRYGNLEGTFFLTKLLDYSTDKKLIEDCKLSRSKNKYTPIPR